MATMAKFGGKNNSSGPGDKIQPDEEIIYFNKLMRQCHGHEE